MLIQFLKTCASANGIFGPGATEFITVGDGISPEAARGYVLAGAAIEVVAPNTVAAPLTSEQIANLVRAGCNADETPSAFEKRMRSLQVDPLVSVTMLVDSALTYDLPGKAGETRQVAASVANELCNAKPPKAKLAGAAA